MSAYNNMDDHDYMFDLCKRLKALPDKIKDIYGYSFVTPYWRDVINVINEGISYIQGTYGEKYNMSVEIKKLKEYGMKTKTFNEESIEHLRERRNLVSWEVLYWQQKAASDNISEEERKEAQDKCLARMEVLESVIKALKDRGEEIKIENL